MKKKGLIISTIVMVVVLVASLTTATYAWFNASAAVSVHDVTVSVASASNISIGLAKNVRTSGEGAVGGSRTTPTSYVNGTITYQEYNTDAGKGLGTFGGQSAKAGLGTSVDWDWVLSSIGGVSSASLQGDPEAMAFDPSYNATHALYNGSLNNAGDLVLGDMALYNGNRAQNTNEGIANTVIFAPFGLRVEKEGMNYLYCDITVTPDAEFWGIVTSLKVEITSTNGNYSARPFEAESLTYQSDTSTVSAKTFRFIIAQDTTDHILYNGETGAQIYTFDIRMFLDGTDETNCIADATQYGASIHMEFNAQATADYDATGKTVYTLGA